MKTATTRGRPRKAKSDRAPTVNFTMRLKPTLLEELRQAASRNERSITAEAEVRLSQPPTNEIGRMVSMVVDTVERRTGQSSSTDQKTRMQCANALHAMHGLLYGLDMPSRDRTEQSLHYNEGEYARAIEQGNKELAENIEGTLVAIRCQLDVIIALGATGRGAKE